MISNTQQKVDQDTFGKNMEEIFGRREKDYGDSGNTDEVAKPTEKNDNRID